MAAPKGNQNAKGKNLGNKYAAGNTGGKANRKPPEQIKEIAYRLIEWSQEKGACHLAQFTTQWNKSRVWLYKLADNHPELEEALDTAKENLSWRYSKNGLDGTWNAAVVLKKVGHYDKELDRYFDEKEEKKRARHEKETQQVIVKAINFANEANKDKK